MSDTEGLIVWFRGVLDRVEEVAQAATGRVDELLSWLEVGVPEAEEHIALHGPFSVLANVAADRALIDEAMQWHGRDLPAGVVDGRDPDEIERDEAVREVLVGVVKTRAAAYAHHPGYRDEWRPA